MYTENDYLTNTILNNIEDKVEELYIKYSSTLSENYTKKIWVDNEYVYVDDIAHIENAIEYLGNYFEYPDGWIVSREWDLTGINNISYKDINRIFNNIKVISEVVENE